MTPRLLLCRCRFLLSAAVLLGAALPARAATHRLYDGITAFVPNPEGKAFTVTLDVRDINIFETGPRELLCKVYDPDGQPVVRKVIADDGVVSQAFLPPMGAWDHEAWYYTYCYQKGTQPMIRWSAFSAPDRLGSVAKRTFRFPIAAGKKGVYRILVVGCIDHYVTLTLDPDLPAAVAGHPDWLHGHGEQWKKSHVYVPRGAKGLHVMLAEYDLPRTRKLKVAGPDGAILYEGSAAGGFTKAEISFAKPGQYDDQVLTVETSAGKGDFLLGLKLRFDKDAEVTQRGERAVTAALAPDAATARAAQNGAIYHDGRLLWHGYQVRLHDWLKKLKPADFEVKDAAGKPADPAPGNPAAKGALAELPTRPGFLPVNGPYWQPTLCDRIMHHYPAHKNRAALNVAVRDLAAGLRSIGPNDHVAVAVGGSFANMAYEFSNYAWHYWRPAWRILQHSDAPDDLKALVKEAFLVAGDRLAFCRTWERVNGNAYAQVLAALRYCHEGTADPIQKELFDVYWQRFTTGGWGERAGVGPSGPIQEGFAYSFHYGSYMLTTWQAILADLKDERFQKVHDKARLYYSYALSEEVPAGPWSARTHFPPHWQIEKDGPFAWKGLPGPDFTVSVNGADEWFAARRKNYYALTYHGRLSPKWETNAHPGQSGYGGGMLCQLHVPGKGPVLASTLNGAYGEGMDPSLWRNFHLHTLVGTTADGRPLVAGDSEHFDARLQDGKVTSSGPVRDSTVEVIRSFTFGPGDITCTVQLKETAANELLSLWLKNELRGKVSEAYEMLPFFAKQKPLPGKNAEDTLIRLSDGPKDLGPLTKDAATARTIRVDRGGFGVVIDLDQPRPVLRGPNNTLLIKLIDQPAPASKIGLSYCLTPFGN